MQNVAQNPKAFVEHLMALRSQVGQMNTQLSEYISEHGPIETESGVFGYHASPILSRQ